MSRNIAGAVLAIVLLGSPAHAQTAPEPDPIHDALVSPDVAMKHAQELGLSEGQIKTIQTDAVDAQQHFVHLQYQLRDARDKLVGLLKASRVDETRSLEQLDTVLHVERDVKRTQLGLMIKIKNVLTPEQQALARKFAADDGK